MKRPPEMSRKAFDAALKRRGWKKVLVWIDNNSGVSIGILYRRGKPCYRASIAHAIAEFDRIAAERAAAQ